MTETERVLSNARQLQATLRDLADPAVIGPDEHDRILARLIPAVSRARKKIAVRDRNRWLRVGESVMARTNLLGWRLAEVVKVNVRTVDVRLTTPRGSPVVQRRLCDVRERT